MFTFTVWIIGLLIILVFAANEYCIYRENEAMMADKNFKQKYLEQIEINKELLDEILKRNEVADFDPEKRL